MFFKGRLNRYKSHCPLFKTGRKFSKFLFISAIISNFPTYLSPKEV